jgi:hypothetical protein
MKAITDKHDNPIGDGAFHCTYDVIDLTSYGVRSAISFSDTTESVYVSYINDNNGKRITARFSHHINNAVKFGDQLNGFIATENEILFHLGLMKRTFKPDVILQLGRNDVKAKKIHEYKSCGLTLSELFDLGAGADLSMYVGMLIEGTNQVITSSKISSRESKFGSFIYETI